METTDDQKNELQVVHEFQNVYSPTTILGVLQTHSITGCGDDTCQG